MKKEKQEEEEEGQQKGKEEREENAPISTHIIILKKYNGFGVEVGTMYLVCIKTIRQGACGKEAGEILRHKEDEQLEISL